MQAVVLAWALLAFGSAVSASYPGWSAADTAGAVTASFDDIAREASSKLASDPAKAASLYRQGLQLRPDWAEGWFYLGAACYQTAEYKDAKAAFRRASELAPQKGAVWAFLGLCEKRLDENQRALADIKKAEQLGLPDDTKFVSTVYRAGIEMSFAAQDFTRTAEQLQRFAKLGDKSPETIAGMGICVLGLPYLPASVPAEQRELVDLAGRAEWALTMQQPSEAAGLIEQLTSRFPKVPGVHYLAGLPLSSHDRSAARAEFRLEIDNNPRSAEARLQIAILDIHDNEPGSAAKLAGEAVNLEPASALAHTVLARALMAQARWKEAEVELHAASALAPGNPQIHLYLQQTYRKLGHPEAADKEQAEFKRLQTGGMEMEKN